MEQEKEYVLRFYNEDCWASDYHLQKYGHGRIITGLEIPQLLNSVVNGIYMHSELMEFGPGNRSGYMFTTAKGL